ncbi:hypothetical protein BDA99DRAFT_531435 [Phascolomyces articulosus]|uniref:Alcohol dehydrogenase-like C-terminal domain-containing protein n=1 Tax=Phascolomyces articulosus TaxID=60185 RepID=A0AAD5KS67_9FUNG|nr:hypothetical protein BDA99DRAFT_531435 [Phascolomyces articulosus]
MRDASIPLFVPAYPLDQPLIGIDISIVIKSNNPYYRQVYLGYRYSNALEGIKPQAGDSILIPSATGVVGLIIGQIAKQHGMYVVGSAGSDEKVAYLKEIGFDAAFNYKMCGVNQKLKEIFPENMSVYFDNIGGDL